MAVSRSSINKSKTLDTPYGTYAEGEVYIPAAGSRYEVKIVDVETYKDVEDIVIIGPNKVPHRVSWLSFSRRYKRP